MAMLPGTYLRLRREADGLSIEDLAAKISTEPRIAERDRAAWLRLIESGIVPIGDHVVATLMETFPFDPLVLLRLDDLSRMVVPGLPEPRLCRKCACSEFDPCRETRRIDGRGMAAEGYCAWVAPDLCSSCPPDGEPGVEAPPAVDDEDETAAPSPDAANDGAQAGIAA